MAEDNQKNLDALLEIENAQKRIDELLRRQAASNEKNAKKLQERIDKEREIIKLKQNQIKQEEDAKKQLEYKNKKQKEINDALDIFGNLEKDVQKSLKGNNEAINAFSSITGQIIINKQKQIDATDEEREVLQKIIDQQEAQVSSIAKMVIHQKKKTEDQQIEEGVRKRMKGASEDEIQSQIILEKLKAKLIKRHERIHQLQHQAAHLAHSLPEGLTSAVKGAVDLGKAIMSAGVALGPIVLLVAVLGAGLHAYAEMEKAAEDFRKETGLTVNQSKEMYDVAHHTTVAYRGMGVTASDALEVVKELKNSQSDMFNFSQSTVDALSLMNARLGITAKDSGEVVSMFEQMGGLSESAATSAALQAANMSAKVGVSTKAVFADMAKSGAVLSKHMRGNVDLFVQQAVKARMLGTSLEGLTKTAENLLNFESSIEDELTAATFVGGQFNLSRARALAYEGKIADANEEVLNQIQRSGDFRKQDYYTQTQLAKAAGKSVEEITKELGVRDKLKSLSGQELKNANALIEKGVDISKLSDADIKKQAEQLAKQERISAVMTDIQDKIAGIIEAVGGRLAPVFDVLGKVIYFIFDVLSGIANIITTIFNPTASLKDLFQKMGPLTSGIAVALTVAGTAVLGSLVPGLIRAGIAAMTALPAMISTAVAAITAASAATLGIGAIAIIGGITAAVMAMKNAQKAGDVLSPADGKTMVSTKEGGLFELSPNDDLVAAPGAARALAGGGGGGGTAPASPIANSNNKMISMLIQEFRGVREDMASGKIGVYMDNEKVTSSVGKSIDSSTRNKFALA